MSRNSVGGGRYSNDGIRKFRFWDGRCSRDRRSRPMEGVIPPGSPIPATTIKTAVCKPPLLEKLLLVAAFLVVGFLVVAFLRLLLGFCLVGRGLSLFTLLLLALFFGLRLFHDLRRIDP